MVPGKKIKIKDRMSYSVSITDQNVPIWMYTIYTAFVTQHIPFQIFTLCSTMGLFQIFWGKCCFHFYSDC